MHSVFTIDKLKRLSVTASGSSCSNTRGRVVDTTEFTCKVQAKNFPFAAASWVQLSPTVATWKDNFFGKSGNEVASARELTGIKTKMADKVEGLLLRLEREVIFARKELSNLRKEMNCTKKMFCEKLNDIQETVEKGFAMEGCRNLKKRKYVNDKRSTVKAFDDGVNSDDLYSSRAIGYVHSCSRENNGCPQQSPVCLTGDCKANLKIEFSGFANPKHSLEGLEKFSHIWIIFVFHKNTNKTVRAKVKPPQFDGAKVGVFSSRSPHRPNAIGLSLAKLDGIYGNVLYLSGIDILDGTPVLDIKPYMPFYDQPVAKEIYRTETCSPDLVEGAATDSSADRQLQQRVGNDSPEKSAYTAKRSNGQSPRHGQYFRENNNLEVDSDIAMETDPEPEDNVEIKTGEFLSVKSEYNPPSSSCQDKVSSGNVAMETTKDARCDAQTIVNVYREEPRMNQENCCSNGSSVCLSKNKRNTDRDSASHGDQHIQEVEILTQDMHVVKVESLSESSCPHQPKGLSERESPHEIVASPERLTKSRTVQNWSAEPCHDQTNWLQDGKCSYSPGSSPTARSPSREESFRWVLTRVTSPPPSLFHQEEPDKDKSPTQQQGRHAKQQATADPQLSGRTRMIWQPDFPRNGIDPHDKESNESSSLHECLPNQNFLRDSNSKGSRNLTLANTQQLEIRPFYQTRQIVIGTPPNKSSSPSRCSPYMLDPCGSVVMSSHDQVTLNRTSPHVMTRHSPTQVRRRVSSPRCSNSVSFAAQDQQCVTRPLVTVPDWIRRPPISKLNVVFSRLAEASLMLFHGKEDIDINVKQDICRNCIENEKADKAHLSSPKLQCAYRLEHISSRSNAKGAIADILKSDPRSMYQRNHCSDEPYCFSVDAINLTCKFEHNTVLIVKIDPVALTGEGQDRVKPTEATRGGNQLSSSAIQFDPSGHRILLGVHHIDAEVIPKNLKEIYDKNQRKTLTGSEQRISKARIDMVATATAEIRRIKVYVQRCPESTRKTGDSVGAIELNVSYEEHDVHRTHFYIDLDSVYKTESGEMVYWLDKVEVEERNKWELIIILEFVDGSFRHFQSKAFRIRTKPRTCKQVVLAPSNF